MTIVKINKKALDRVMDGIVGMTFIVDKFTDTINNRRQIAHVRDYRYNNNGCDYQIWSIGPDSYEIIEE